MRTPTATEVALATLASAARSRNRTEVFGLNSLGAFTCKSSGYMLEPEHHWDVKPDAIEDARAVRAIWYVSRSIISKHDSVLREMQAMNQVVGLVDAVPHHNDVLDSGLADAVCALNGVSSEQRELDLAIAELRAISVITNEMNSSLDGKFRKELKVQVTDRVRRHNEATQQLVSNLEAVRLELKYQVTPHSVRKQACINMLEEVENLIESFDTHAPKQIEAAPEPFRARLIHHLGVLKSVRADLRRWRDNPSQRLAKKFGEAVAAVQGVCTDFLLMKDDAFTAANELGMTFFTRAGPSRRKSAS